MKRFVRSKKEIIISAGTAESAKLLLLSGIGPRSHLKSVNVSKIFITTSAYNLKDHTSTINQSKTKYFKIPTLVDLPVGRRFQDQVSAGFVEFTINQSLSFTPKRDLRLSHLIDYFIDGTGNDSANKY